MQNIGEKLKMLPACCQDYLEYREIIVDTFITQPILTRTFGSFATDVNSIVVDFLFSDNIEQIELCPICYETYRHPSCKVSKKKERKKKYYILLN